jgi:D-serine deaminase-like pyridoxal phosphate-dependent protein
VQNTLRAYSAVTGTWASLSVTVDTTDTFKAAGNTVIAASPVQNTLRAYSAITGTWATLSVTVDTTDVFKVGSIAGIDNN